MGLFTLDWKLDGPLHRLLVNELAKRTQVNEQAEEGDKIVGLVYSKPIYQSQVDWHIQQRLWQEGLDTQDEQESLSPARCNELQIWATWQVIDEELLKIKARHHSKSFPVDEAQLEIKLQAWLTQHATDKAGNNAVIPFIQSWRQRTATRGDLEQGARVWLRDQWRMELYLEDKVQQYLTEQADNYQQLFTSEELAQLSDADKQVYQQAWGMIKRQEAVDLYREQLRNRERPNVEVK